MLRELRYIVFFLLGFLLFAPAAQAAETIIVGEVFNETTGEPIPNVNIHFRGTKIGTTSDENGSYALRVDVQAKSQLVFSAVGYYSQRFDIVPGAMAGLQVMMRERVATLTEIVVAPGENPALEILRQVRAHRPDNDRTLHPEQTAVVHRDEQLYISHIQRRHLRRALWRSLQAGMIQQEDSTYIMPLYRETQSFRLEGANMIPANDQQTQALVLTATDYSSLLGGEGNLNFYANSVSIMGHAFLSPLASGGNLYYRYYIEEEENLPSLQGGDGGRHVVIHFRTRNPFYATFNGTLLIDTTTFALRSLQAYVPAEVAVNYVNTLHVSQTLLPDGTLAEENLSLLLDFAVKTDQAGTVFPTVLLTNSLRNPNISLSPVNGQQLIANSQQPASAEADSAFTALDSLPVVRVAKWVATIATTGYIPTGTPVDIGHVQEILQVNQHEGVHVGLPFRTNEKMSKWVSLEASVGYGFRDRQFKGMGRVSVNLPTLRKQTMDLEYQDHYVWSEVDDFSRLMRENSMGWRTMDFTAYAFEALRRDTFCTNSAMRQRQLQLHWFADWGESLATRLGHPVSVESHAYIRAGWQEGYAYQSLSLIGRLGWGERKYDGYFMRRYAYSGRYPVLYLGAEFGHWNQINGEAYKREAINAGTTGSHLYAHLRVMLTQHAQLGMGGTLTYAFQAGAIFGRVPQTMLWQAQGNQGFAYDPYRFTLLHNGEMAADRYLALHAEWNGMGILFNLIPGIRWLHLRELVEAKLAYGYLSFSPQDGLSASAVLQQSGLSGGAGRSAL
ncbi:MAG: carboxypeptidase-like regulatory domain-containing protein, partial [Paludibacteraceae bacterium]|nr:carboxypeptidase-like regulatory domain-containing protein [Paludibacteraceae bacterium]